MLGLIGRKCGMTRIFADDGSATPVTVVEVLSNHVTQIKELSKDGYSAVQLAGGRKKKANRVAKPLAGHFKKAGVEAQHDIHEFHVAEEDLSSRKLGDEINVDLFSDGQRVDVTSKSKGKGFQGTVKRWNFSMQRATHGNSLSHRAPGSTGQCQTPGRVFPGKKMAGQMGNAQVTVSNQVIHKVDVDRNLLMIKGAVPGGKGCTVVVKPAKVAAKQTGGKAS